MTDPQHLWWHDAVVYQIYVRSFQDSDGDGVGDLPGITTRLPYLAELGVDALWLTPFYRSPMADHGYDVADQCDVDPLFGSLDDADRLLARAHELGLRVLVDLVPNHTSDVHPWFQQALHDPQSPMRDRYLFRAPGPDGGPPNNWESVFGGDAWTLDPGGTAYYLHLFDAGQPDVDWRHPALHVEWERILRFWLDRGVDGFRIDVAHGLYKRGDLADNPPHAAIRGSLFHANAMPHAWDQPEVVDVYRRWRQITDEYDGRVMVGEVFLEDVGRVARYVGADRLHQSFNFPLLAAPFDAALWKDLISTSLLAFEVGGAGPTWVLSNHDVVRHASRYGGGERGRARAAAATLTLLALPGCPYLYQGEELGLEQSDVPEGDRQDPIWLRSGEPGRDGCRTPLPWEAASQGHGFTSGAPWLPFGADATTRAVDAQGPGSVLELYRTALSLRKDLRRHLSQRVCWEAAPEGALAYSRELDGGGRLLCALATGADVALQIGAGTLLLGSGPGARCQDGVLHLPVDTTAWVRLDTSSPGSDKPVERGSTGSDRGRC